MLERKLYFLASSFYLTAFIYLLVCSIPFHLILAALLIILYPFVFDRSRRGFLPILMFHSVSDNYHRFCSSHLTVSRRNFNNFMRFLKMRGYVTLTLDEAEDFMRGKRQHQRAVVLTFDDGFLDNWVNVTPILESYQQHGTVFVSYDFIIKDSRVRPRNELNSRKTELEEWSYLSEGETLAMHNCGCMEFYPHGVSHTTYVSGPELVGFHLPGTRSWWLDWNHDPTQKPFWIDVYPRSRVPWGVPLFTTGKALEARRFFPDREQLKKFQEIVSTLSQPLSQEQLFSIWDDLFGEREVAGVFETDDDYLERLKDELEKTKLYLENLLGKECTYFCWPGGGKERESIEMAYQAVGYRFTTTKQQGTPNRCGAGGKWFFRISAGYSKLFENRLWNILKFISHVETYRRNYNWIVLFGLIEITELCSVKMGRARRNNDWIFKASDTYWDQNEKDTVFNSQSL